MAIQRRTLLLAAAGMPLARSWAAPSSFPSRPIRLVISFPPGSTSDMLARHLGEKLSSALGQPVVVESKPGAQGVIAARAVIHAAADGHTLFLGTNSSHAANVYLIRNLGYDPIGDFSPIGQITTNPLLLVVNADRPVNSLGELVSYARAHPGQLNYGTGNSGSLVAAQLLKSQTGIQAQAVNYPGMPQATTDLVAGRLDFMMVDPLVIQPFVASGQVRILGLTSPQRLDAMPKVAPLSELGVPGYRYESWSGLFGPAGLPADVTEKLSAVLAAAVNSNTTKAYFSRLGVIATASDPQHFGQFVREQIVLWRTLSRDAGLAVN
ncbi:Bug family tripartite tricarboxylate transporter substrate binding protein [Advenella mimigardefordensis]|uniref:Putative Bug-like extracytoplasmic solute binding receptor, TTT family n=1 Tax=Advenella mimigardefordensis (strain DSM 17166 / LMG 22922 / DPN7) TaxID=1247726 RepID=W0PDE5_ADVMD|nr:tripartite tricarboxylate transporter substrate binding protein [Advenella mimigardefordensis]AHG63487.1 putative Bug-like extracytoplasmic solute binding receptor, TTT family [Advenella mimigardefordensis DPN7]